MAAVCPGAPYGPPFTGMAKGNVPTSVGLTVMLTGSNAASSLRQRGPTLEAFEGPHPSLDLGSDSQAGNFIATFQCPVSSPMARQMNQRFRSRS